MTASRIIINFNQDLPVGAQLGFNIYNNGGSFGIPTAMYHIFNWVNIRSANNQVSQGTPTTAYGERSAINFQTAFNLDTAGQYTVTRVNNVVIIRAENINSFTEFSVGGVFAPYTNHPGVSIFY